MVRTSPQLGHVKVLRHLVCCFGSRASLYAPGYFSSLELQRRRIHARLEGLRIPSLGDLYASVPMQAFASSCPQCFERLHT